MTAIDVSFDNFIQLLNQAPSIDKLSKFINHYLTHETIKEFEQNDELATEIIRFFNNIIPIITGPEEKDIKRINKALDKLGITNSQITNEEISQYFYKKIIQFRNNKFESTFSSLNWQINVIDRKNDNMNLDKNEKIEIVTKLNSFNLQTQKYESNVIKMNYNEFTEIFNNLKKIDEQLHLFKQ